MNILIVNEHINDFNNSDIDIIKNFNGVYKVEDLSGLFQNFHYKKIIIDITAISDYKNIITYKNLIKNIPSDKIIIYISPNEDVNSSVFIKQLIECGIYNFTTSVDGIKYLEHHNNTYDEVVNITKMASNSSVMGMGNFNMKIIGIKNITEAAGATTFCYLLKKSMEKRGYKTYAIEVNKKDFNYFRKENMFSITTDTLYDCINKCNDAKVVFVDLNDLEDTAFCDDILYLLEPSTLKLNKLLSTKVDSLSKYKENKIVINKCFLSNSDIGEFEYEAKLKVYYNVPSLDDRIDNIEIDGLLVKLGFLPNDVLQKKGKGFFGFFSK